MNMPYEMFLTIQLMHLTCRKYRVQSPTRKEGQDLFQRTSDDSSRNNPSNEDLNLCYKFEDESL